ncbi:hypothetical protein ES332_D02G063600v1 [Gossypium tomentosum]|uniref:Uncharacterized protein n=1 Tax=Gossypium tomentosum TaxID=34277 RepID=A0A5D2LTW1_GOSTO|nr:hypothetical protein ES332_D02G063600v1 [Gossypium tomentosum]TYH82478.1 hypothetical protein ES332_D02G063600v1 [Gossypium tomentosum]TYH82479.1 hypothetical protein ES332_D02G063600v1 [Gossypium tomentosum]TYH82480.1 hypothetical protein ES332_D02G063600v1 [Gossypium tomentosum]TYH82481.1 hypothetical protein ES332_D02G063600v1 [Gossypium tomentosum]
MDDAFGSGQKDDQGKDKPLQNLDNNRDMSGENGLDYSELKLKRLARRVIPQHALILSVGNRLEAGKSPVKDSFLPSIFSVCNTVPRHVITLDEKYLRRCLELICINAAKAAQCNISESLSSVEMSILSDGLNSPNIGDEDACDFQRFVFDRPLAVGTGGVVIRPVGQWVVSSKTGSRSMANILKSPLLQKFGASDVSPSSNAFKRSVSYDFMNSPGSFSNYSSHKLGSETPISKNHKYGSETAHKQRVSESSTDSTCSDQSFSSTSTAISRGMLQCTWKGGIPYFVFSLDNRKEVYVANLSKEGSARGKGPDFMYSFHSSKGSHKEHGISDDESHLVAKMKVMTSFSICPQGSKIMETEFVLFSGNETFNPEVQTPSYNHRKNKGLPKKVVEAFKSSHSSKPRTIRRLWSSSIVEDSSWGPCQDTVNGPNSLDKMDLLEEEFSPNLELASIVVRNHLPKNPLPEVGGWGLKFLKKAGVTAAASVPCNCSLNTDDCSTSTDILVPAGIHGGPRNDGPSSLIERWRSGGHCDCGGWDLGCPLTVLRARASKQRGLPSTDPSEACMLFDFFVQGSKHGSPTLRIANVHDGLYFLHFQTTLSALQSFSIAVAYIHAQSPNFRQKNVKLSR